MENKNLIAFQSLQLKNAFIKSIEDKSDSEWNRALVLFNNGLMLSIISGPNAYCGEGEFEIAPKKANGDWMPEAFEEEDKDGDDVLGYCNPEKVAFYINKIGSIKA